LRSAGGDELWEIEETVPLALEMTAYAMELERLSHPPALYFSHVEGFEIPVVSNLYASRRRLARVLDLEEQDLVRGWGAKADRRFEPIAVNEAPVKEVVLKGSEIDLLTFPIPVHFEGDGGRYISSGVTVACDPDTSVGNLNYTRLEVKGPNVMGASLHSRGDLWDFQRRAELGGKALQVAVVVGAPPTVAIAGATQLPIDEDEMALAGGLLGEPIEVIPAEMLDLMVPARAELIIEGEIEPGAREHEGPFSEYTGYSTDRSTGHVFKVKAITHRRNMIFQDVVPGNSSEHLNLSKVSRVPRSYQLLKSRFSNLVDISYPRSGTHYHCYVSLHDPRPGQVRQLMMLLFGFDMYLKLIVVVDDDIDIHDERSVMWALATRFQADRDLLEIDGASGNILDPSMQGEVSAKLGLDATRRPDFSAKGLAVPEELVAKVKNAIAQRRTST
jgi:2,5-furandicarboxylate decarboxylase 1